MPCRDGGPTLESEQQSKIHDLTRMLCSVLEMVESEHMLGNIHGEVHAWWDRHKKEDIERKRQESARRTAQEKKLEALSKLTPEERRLLGLQ